jgi:putative hydroxymethylpyrimidine transport system substrate-binding protein
VDELGIPDYDELVLVALTERTEEEPELMRDFATATARGAAAAVANPEDALSALSEAPERNPAISPRAMAAQVRRTLPLLSKSGRVDLDRLERLVDWMREQGMIQRELPTTSLVFSS